MAVKAVLTDTKVKNAKPGTRPYKLGDGGWLYLLVKPSSAKLWRMAYRYAGREKLLALGAYPEVSLKDAREKRDEERARLRKGFDPSEVRKLERLTQANEAATTFRLVAEEYLARQGGRKRAEATQIKNRWLLEQAYPDIGDRPIASIKSAEVLAVLRKRSRRVAGWRRRAGCARSSARCSVMPSRQCAPKPIRPPRCAAPSRRRKSLIGPQSPMRWRSAPCCGLSTALRASRSRQRR
jgi:hypothetical protein